MSVQTLGGAGPTVRLRSLRRQDGESWRVFRIRDEALLRPVEPTIPDDWELAHSPLAWRRTWANLKQLARRGELVPAAIEVDGNFAGQLTLGNVQYGVVSSCWIGYWVVSALQGQGVATAAVALGVDHAMRPMGLHRVEATVMEDNVASRAVLAKVGFREEGKLLRNLHINGQWQDHLLVGMTREDVEQAGHRTVVGRLIHRGDLAPEPGA
ncbi:GNAT family N-acetyltransferase [Corynebacterium urogenitale]